MSLSGGGYYDDRNPLLKGTLSSVERDRLRERERLARAAMSVQAEQAAAGSGPDARHHHHHHSHARHHHSSILPPPNLFPGPVRVNPDPEIQSKLGNYALVRQALIEKPKRLIGIDCVPPSPSPMPTAPVLTSPAMLTGPAMLTAPAFTVSVPIAPTLSAPLPSTSSGSSGSEFKKPGGPRSTSAASSSSSTSNQQRGGFVKPTDSKPSYNGRGSYAGQPVKHDYPRTHGLLSVKLPSQLPPAITVGSNGVPIVSSGGSAGISGSLASRTQFAERLKLIEVNVTALSISAPACGGDVAANARLTKSPTTLIARLAKSCDYLSRKKIKSEVSAAAAADAIVARAY
ncbi:PREDICTED: AF4/FMR2 family member 4-like [Wasmannia auropunctata]|uniref:AF4/FMR2 family member 4-like n=1 Tax=Wasmannia auropunctata TaxID=64793 RepID=UPI0005EF52F1|nr:PREDICTED: AF4/FMR2 family member 4-like [Wasmannia auropunctata]